MSLTDLSVDHITPSRDNLFTSVRLDRLAERRDDPEWVEHALNSDAATLVPLWRSRNLIEGVGPEQQAVYLSPAEREWRDLSPPPTLLGTDGKRDYFTVSISDRQREQVLAARPAAQFLDLRLASIDMDAKHAGVLAYAKALHYWQYRNAFCGVCGSLNRLESAGHRLVCTNEECANWPPRRFSTLAGFVEPGESLEDAVVREVYEEAGVRLRDIRYVSSQPWPFPASAMCGFYAEAASRDHRASEEMTEVRWLTASELKAAVTSDEVRLPPPVSIAFRLIADWYWRVCGEDLEPLVRSAGSWRARSSGRDRS